MMSFFKSFGYAFKGLYVTIRGERNFRFHIVAAGYSVWLAIMFRLEDTEFILLVLTITLVLASELINTAFEISWHNPEDRHYEKAGTVKDIAAAAVLVCAVGAVAVGLFLFLRIDKLISLAQLVFSNPLYAVIFAASLVVSFLFIFKIKEN